jgi:cell division protein FtsI (penicillin-binding protein 3)
MRRRKNPRGKLAAALVLVAVAALLFMVPTRAPEPETGESQELVPEGTFAGRKNIYDRRLRELAVSIKLTSVYARPLELRDPEMIAGEIATILEREEKELLSALRSERGFVWLGRRLDAAKAERITALNAKGLYFVDEEQRYYPHRETAAHVLGFLSNEQGLAGIEFHYEQILQGGWGRDRKLPSDLAIPDMTGEKGGAHLVLTLDLDLQALVERELVKARQETGAAAAMALVMAAGSGEIHALVNLPAFDPNRFWEYDAAARRNRVLVDPVYPGGLWNLFRVAAGGVEPGASEEGGEAPLRRKAAEGKAGDLHPDWAELEKGLFGSPALLDLGPAPDGSELDQLLRNLETAATSGIDLPLEPESSLAAEPVAGVDLQGDVAALSALQLLTAFNRSVSGGGTAPPHLLKALWPAEHKPLAVEYEKKPSSAGSSAQVAVMRIVHQDGEQAGGMAESLFDKRVLAPAADAGAADEDCHRQDVLLGISRGEKPFTFLLVLDGACIDPAKPSLLRHAGRRVLKWLASPPAKADEAVAPGGTHPEKLLGQWRQVHDPAAPGGGLAPLEIIDRMPDVKGHALRQALQELQPYGLPIEVAGSGRVAGQEPKAGSPLKGVGRIRLELKAD